MTLARFQQVICLSLMSLWLAGCAVTSQIIGAPAFTVPLIGFSMPEITVFKDVKHNGYAEIKISTTDAATGEFVGETAPGIGKSNHDDYTLLIIVHFTRTDLEKEQWDLGA